MCYVMCMNGFQGFKSRPMVVVDLQLACLTQLSYVFSGFTSISQVWYRRELVKLKLKTRVKLVKVVIN